MLLLPRTSMETHPLIFSYTLADTERSLLLEHITSKYRSTAMATAITRLDGNKTI